MYIHTYTHTYIHSRAVSAPPELHNVLEAPMMDLIDVKIALQMWRGREYIHNQDELGICGKAFLILDRAPQIVSLADELVEYRAREYDSHANVLASGAVQPPRSRRAGSRRRRPFRVCADVGHYKHKQFTAALTFSSELLPRAPMCSSDVGVRKV